MYHLKGIYMNLKRASFTIALTGLIFFITNSAIFAQKVGFIASNVIRNYFLDAKQAEQRIQSIVDEWKRTLDVQQQEIDALEFEIQKNRLVWSDQERLEKERELEEMKRNRQAFAKTKFEPGGEYDVTVKNIMLPVEQKIFAAIQEIASNEGYDIIWDQSTQPLVYVNFKYDLTVKVLKKLGVNVDELEKELQEKISKDPRNVQREQTTPRRKTRTRTITDDSREREIERPDATDETTKPDESIEQKPEDIQQRKRPR